MNIYLLERTDCGSYDSFDSVVVIAEGTTDAKAIHPSGRSFKEEASDQWNGWVNKKSLIKITKIGVADKGQERGVVLASFNAG